MAEHDLGELISRASNSLEADLSFLTAYSAVAGGISDLPEGTELPEAELFFTYGFGPVENDGGFAQNPIIDQVRENFGLHSSRYAVLAMITAFEVYLERIHWISLLIKHAASQGAEIASERMFALRDDSLRIAMGKNPPQMVAAILLNVGDDSSLESLEWVRSIYGARKILSHRNGTVSDVDVDSDGKFRLLRRTVEVDEDKDGTGVLRLVETASEYAVGEELEITPKDCQEIAFALVSASDDLTNILAETGRRIVEAKLNDDED